MIRASVEGVPELMRRLRQLGPEFELAASRGAVVPTALAIHGGYRSRLTAQNAVDTGRLRNSVAIAEEEEVLASNSATATGRNEGNKQAPNMIRDGMLTALIGTNVQYAKRIEFGFVGTDALGRTYNQAARPSLVPAAEEQQGPYQDRLRAVLSRTVRDVRP
jgi:hypothetical protein